jgi:hypothetical protein
MMVLVKLVVALLHCGLLRDVETVEELSDILVLDGGRLLDEGCGLRDCLDGVSGDDELVLLFLAVLALDSIVHANAADEFLAQEVTDFDQAASLRDGAIDGEMSVDSAHLVLVAVGDALDQVLDVRADSAHGGQLLLLAEPFLNLEGLLVWHVDVDGQVSEGLGQGSAGSLDGNDPGLDADVNALRVGVQNLHLF